MDDLAPTPVFDRSADAPLPIFDAGSRFDGFERDRRDTRQPRSVTTAQLMGDPSARGRRQRHQPRPSDAPIQAAIADLDEAALLVLQALEALGADSVALHIEPNAPHTLAALVSRIADRGRASVYLQRPHLRPKSRYERTALRAYERPGA
jgi:hypothetical protein